MKRAASIVILLVLGMLLIAGSVQLIGVRIREGNIYPPYSSFRADPLGTKVLHDALSELMPVRRQLRQLDKLSDEPPRTTLLFAGAEYDRIWSATDQQNLETIPRSGGRLVVAFYPAHETAKEQAAREERARKLDERFRPKPKQPKEEKPPSPRPGEKEQEEQLSYGKLGFINMEAFSKRWGLALKLRQTKHANPVAEFDLGDGLSRKVSWHSTLYFDSLEPRWKVIARCEGEPVAIEQNFNHGTIVLTTDSFFLSNEAMLKERQPEILSWLIGSGTSVLFEETHLSVMEQPGIVSLARRYRLHGIAIVLLIAVGLFSWRNATSLVPAYQTSADNDAPLLGRDAASGFTNLLRRSIPAREVLKISIEEWKRSLSRVPHPDAMHRIEDVQNQPGTNPVEGYRQITKILSERKL